VRVPAPTLRHTIGHDDRAHRRHVDQDAARRRVSGQAVAAAPRRPVDAVPPREGDDLRDILGDRTAHDGLGADLVEAGDERPASPLVLVRPGQHNVTGKALL